MLTIKRINLILKKFIELSKSHNDNHVEIFTGLNGIIIDVSSDVLSSAESKVSWIVKKRSLRIIVKDWGTIGEYSFDNIIGIHASNNRFVSTVHQSFTYNDDLNDDIDTVLLEELYGDVLPDICYDVLN